MVAVRGILRVSAARLVLAVLLALLLGATWGGGGAAVEASHTPNVVAVVPVGTGPEHVAVHPTANRVYTANTPAGTVSVVDATTNAVITNVSVGASPGALAVDTSLNRLFVASGAVDSVAVIDTTTNTQLDTDGNSGNGITPIPVGDGPHGVGIDQTLHRVYVANEFSGTVTVINGSTFAVITTIPVGSTPIGGIGMNSATSRAYVPNRGSGTVSVINTSTNTVAATIPVAGGPVSVPVNTVTNRAYATNESAGTVSVIDTTNNTVTGTIGVGGTVEVAAVDVLNNRIYVPVSSQGVVAMIDGATNAVIARVPTGTNPHTAAVMPATSRLYVSSAGTSKLWVFSFPTHSAPGVTDPSLVSFQGRLTDGSGNPVANGNYSLTFRIYDAASGGTVQWQETQMVVVSGSVFSVLLGSSTPLMSGAFVGSDRYLEVQVASDPPLSPRQRLGTVPYAFNAQSLNGVAAEELMARDGIILHVGSAQTCPANFTLLMDVNAGVNGTDASRACSTTTYTQVFYIGSTQTCPTGWSQADINAAVMGTSAADACYR